MLRDGQRYTGLLVERTPERVVLRIAGIDTAIPTAQIDRITLMRPVLDRYREMRAAISDDDVEQLLMLAEWLRSRNQWDAALKELDHILRVQPQNGEAKRLRVLVESQRMLAERAGQGRSPAPSSGPRTSAADDGTDGFPLLSADEINLIKVYEVDLTNPPRMHIGRDTIRRLIEKYAADPLIPKTPEGREALLRATPARILDLMFRLQAREFYGEVRVVDQPRSLRLFRDDVHRGWLLNSCGTNRCHGGSEAGRLALYTRRPGSDATVYTNFLILERFRLSDGRPLINYDDPAASPLLQMGLPREGSSAPHPVVPATSGTGDLWRPTFRNADDHRFAEAVEWIKSMYRPRPNYPIQYVPPTPQGLPPPDPNAPPVQR